MAASKYLYMTSGSTRIVRIAALILGLGLSSQVYGADFLSPWAIFGFVLGTIGVLMITILIVAKINANQDNELKAGMASKGVTDDNLKKYQADMDDESLLTLKGWRWGNLKKKVTKIHSERTLSLLLDVMIVTAAFTNIYFELMNVLDSSQLPKSLKFFDSALFWCVCLAVIMVYNIWIKQAYTREVSLWRECYERLFKAKHSEKSWQVFNRSRFKWLASMAVFALTYGFSIELLSLSLSEALLVSFMASGLVFLVMQHVLKDDRLSGKETVQPEVQAVIQEGRSSMRLWYGVLLCAGFCLWDFGYINMLSMSIFFGVALLGVAGFEIYGWHRQHQANASNQIDNAQKGLTHVNADRNIKQRVWDDWVVPGWNFLALLFPVSFFIERVAYYVFGMPEVVTFVDGQVMSINWWWAAFVGSLTVGLCATYAWHKYLDNIRDIYVLNYMDDPVKGGDVPASGAALGAASESAVHPESAPAAGV